MPSWTWSICKPYLFQRLRSEVILKDDTSGVVFWFLDKRGSGFRCKAETTRTLKSFTEYIWFLLPLLTFLVARACCQMTLLLGDIHTSWFVIKRLITPSFPVSIPSLRGNPVSHIRMIYPRAHGVLITVDSQYIK